MSCTSSEVQMTPEQFSTITDEQECKKCHELVYSLNSAIPLTKCTACSYLFCKRHQNITGGHQCDYLVSMQCGHCQENIQSSSTEKPTVCGCGAVSIRCTVNVVENTPQQVETVFWKHIRPNPVEYADCYDLPLYTHPIRNESDRFAGGVGPA